MRRLFLALALCPFQAVASDWSAVQLHDAYVQYTRYFDGGRYPLITNAGNPEGRLGHELNLSLNLDIFKYGLWDSTVHSMTDQSQFRLVGLESRLGARITPNVEINYYHYSQHSLDYSFPWGFPVQDGVQLRLYFQKSADARRSLF